MRHIGVFSTYNRVIATHKQTRDYLRLGMPLHVPSESEAEFEAKTKGYDLARSQLGLFGAGEAPFIQRLVQLSDSDVTRY